MFIRSNDKVELLFSMYKSDVLAEINDVDFYEVYENIECKNRNEFMVEFNLAIK